MSSARPFPSSDDVDSPRDTEATAAPRADPTMTAARCLSLYVGGMTCGGCVANVQENLAALDGVVRAVVDFDTKRADLFVEDDDDASANLRHRAEDRVRSLGYDVLRTSSSAAAEEDTQVPVPPPLLPSEASVAIAAGAAAGAGGRPRQGDTIPSLRRFRRMPCGCGGRGCLCAYTEEPEEMLTEGTRLLTSGDRPTERGREVVKAGEEEAALPLNATEPTMDATYPARMRACATAAATAASRYPDGDAIASPFLDGNLKQKNFPMANANAAAKAPPAKTRLLIEGMSCASCAARIEAALTRMPGVHSAAVNFSTMSGLIVHDAAVVTVGKVVTQVAEMGYTVNVQSTTAMPELPREMDPATDRDEVEKERGECCCRTNPHAFPVHVGNSDDLYEHCLLIKGMSCTSCAARIESTLRSLPTVVSCTVSFSSSVGFVKSHSPESFVEICKVVQSLGYDVTDMALLEPDATLSRTKDALQRTREIAEHERNLIASAILSVPLVGVMIMMITSDVMDKHLVVARIIDGVQLAVTTPIVFYFGRAFFVNAWRGLQHCSCTMDTLVALGTGCTYVYSLAVYLLMLTVYPHSHAMVYFDTAGMLTTFMLLGRFLEARAKRSTSSALIELMSLVPTTALCVQPDGTEVRVSSGELQKGATVRVLAGDRVPVDGTILDGSSELDEQMVTGESLPKHKKPGENVVGGTLNITATLLIRADKVGEETMIAQVLRIVQEAQNTKPAVQLIADQVAMYFVPFVLGISVLTLLVWLILGATHAYPVHWRKHGTSWEGFAFNFFISTVVAACPCALGLATPTAIMVGTGVGAKNGVLVKSGNTLEAVRRVNCVVLDKTGTITNGRLEVVRTQTMFDSHSEIDTAASFPSPLSGLTPSMACRLVGLAEAQSNHPIAKAVSTKLLAETAPTQAPPPQHQDAQYTVSSVVTHGGKGLEAQVSVSRTTDADLRVYHLLVGNATLLREKGVTLARAWVQRVEEENSHGLTTVLAAVDGVACVLVSLADEPKREAHGVIRHLHRAGIRVLMVTGDNVGVAGRIASEMGILPDDVRAEALPTTKAEIVQQLQEEGFRVMFVGDGINDSPALAQANVGVALGAGTEVAIEAADAVLVRNSLVDLLNLQSLSRVTVRRIYGNFLWAFGYNILMLPIASGLLFPLFQFQLPPVVAGLAMMLSSLSVLTSSLTIRCFRPHRESDLYYQ